MKTLIILILMFVNISLFAQEKPKYIYCEILGFQKMLSNKVAIQISFGQKLLFFSDRRLKDPKTGKNRVFNSMIDALNYMGKNGWEFEQAYIVRIQNQNVYHYLMKKDFNDLDEDQKETVLGN